MNIILKSNTPILELIKNNEFLKIWETLHQNLLSYMIKEKKLNNKILLPSFPENYLKDINNYTHFKSLFNEINIIFGTIYTNNWKQRINSLNTTDLYIYIAKYVKNIESNFFEPIVVRAITKKIEHPTPFCDNTKPLISEEICEIVIHINIKKNIKTNKSNISDLELCKKLIQLEKSARERNLEFNVSFKRLKQLWRLEKCQITGKKFDHHPGETLELNKSIERLDNSKGYIDDNIIICTQGINSRKGQLSIEEIVQIYKALKKFKKI